MLFSEQSLINNTVHIKNGTIGAVTCQVNLTNVNLNNVNLHSNLSGTPSAYEDYVNVSSCRWERDSYCSELRLYINVDSDELDGSIFDVCTTSMNGREVKTHCIHLTIEGISI